MNQLLRVIISHFVREGNLLPDKIGMIGNSRFEIDASGDLVQSLAPPSNLQRFEGIAFSSSGNIIGVATSDTNTVFLFRRKANGLFEDTPYWILTDRGPDSSTHTMSHFHCRGIPNCSRWHNAAERLPSMKKIEQMKTMVLIRFLRFAVAKRN